MANITFDISITPDEEKDCVLDCFAKDHGYIAEEGLTKEEFMQKEVASLVWSSFVAEKTRIVQEKGRVQVLQEISEVTIE